MRNNGMQQASQNAGCDYKFGTLPSVAPLATTYVPEQQKAVPKYGAEEALTRGTLFPGLDLPFMNIANNNNPYKGTPLGELMALNFVIEELNLYLDTHKNDTAAFEALQEVINMYEEGYKRYVKRFGPIKVTDLDLSEKFDWLRDPWPWEYCERRSID